MAVQVVQQSVSLRTVLTLNRIEPKIGAAIFRLIDKLPIAVSKKGFIGHGQFALGFDKPCQLFKLGATQRSVEIGHAVVECQFIVNKVIGMGLFGCGGEVLDSRSQ